MPPHQSILHSSIFSLCPPFMARTCPLVSRRLPWICLLYNMWSIHHDTVDWTPRLPVAWTTDSHKELSNASFMSRNAIGLFIFCSFLHFTNQLMESSEILSSDPLSHVMIHKSLQHHQYKQWHLWDCGNSYLSVMLERILDHSLLILQCWGT